MANISDVCGCMGISGNWDTTDITNLLYVLMTQDSHEYFMHFDNLEIDNQKGFDDSLKALVHGEELPFYGSGRWTFQINLEQLHIWSNSNNYNNDLKELMTSSEYFKRRKQLIRSMKKKDLSLEWSWREYEPGCAFICEQTGRHFVNDKDELEYVVSDSKCYDSTLKNYVEIFMEGDDEPLGNAAWDIAKELKLDPHKWIDPICDLIKKHPTWYNLTEGMWYEGDLEAIPEQLGEDVMRLVNEGHV